MSEEEGGFQNDSRVLGNSTKLEFGNFQSASPVYIKFLLEILLYRRMLTCWV